MAMSPFLLGWVKGRGGLAAALSPALAAPLHRSTHRHMCLLAALLLHLLQLSCSLAEMGLEEFCQPRGLIMSFWFSGETESFWFSGMAPRHSKRGTVRPGRLSLPAPGPACPAPGDPLGPHAAEPREHHCQACQAGACEQPLSHSPRGRQFVLARWPSGPGSKKGLGSSPDKLAFTAEAKAGWA